MTDWRIEGAAYLDGLRRQHQALHGRCPRCNFTPAPCDVVTLLDHIAALTEQLATLREKWLRAGTMVADVGSTSSPPSLFRLEY